MAEGGVGLFGHHHFVEQLKISAIGAGAELLDLWQRAGLLGAEVVAGEAQYGQTLGAVALLKHLQACVLASEAAAAGHVHDQEHLAGPFAQVALVAFGVANGHIAH